MNINTIIILLLFMIGILHGQQQSNNNISFWVGCGVGVSDVFHSNVQNSIQYTVGIRNNKLSVKYYAINNVESIIRRAYTLTTYETKYPKESINSQSLQLGYTVNIRKREVPDSIVGCKEVNLTFYSGVVRYHSVTRGAFIVGRINGYTYNEITKSGIGFPLELELEWRYNNYCAATTSIYAEIHDSQSYVGILVNFIVGIM